MKYQIIINDWNGPGEHEPKWEAFKAAIADGTIKPDDVDFVEV